MRKGRGKEVITYDTVSHLQGKKSQLHCCGNLTIDTSLFSNNSIASKGWNPTTRHQNPLHQIPSPHPKEVNPEPAPSRYKEGKGPNPKLVMETFHSLPARLDKACS